MKDRNLTQYVDPFVGTAYTGHTTPAAACPLGFVQPGLKLEILAGNIAVAIIITIR